ncbi:hypothetical protein ACDQ55_16460 [Chitinophaga sp. 30R24]|uniref:hypothetical protein n=1 Tax=Chitinophaga sp. 30R24 TaxID=3248838 RepID=UPI003B91B622
MMKVEKLVPVVIEELKVAQDNNHIEKIISAAIADIERNANADTVKLFVLQLRTWLENLSPLDWDSTQWGCLRYAFIFLQNYSIVEVDKN